MKCAPVLLCLLALASCSGKPPEPRARPAHVSTPFDGMHADEQRARDVQKVVDKQATDQRKEIEAQQP